MAINVGTRQLAEAQIQSVGLVSLIGAYELVFAIRLNVAADPEAQCSANIVGARVTASSNDAQSGLLGFARPEQPFDVVCRPDAHPASHTLHLHLHPGQLAALEALRGAGDVLFDLLIQGSGRDAGAEVRPFQDQWRYRVPRSDWIDKLREAGARDILLLEVPLALIDADAGLASLREPLQEAESHLRNGDYNASIGSCRIVMEEVGGHVHGPEGWHAKALDRFRSDRKTMTKPEREDGIWAALTHYAHLAHHGPAEGGSQNSTRSEAQFLLSLVGACVARAEQRSSNDA